MKVCVCVCVRGGETIKSVHICVCVDVCPTILVWKHWWRCVWRNDDRANHPHLLVCLCWFMHLIAKGPHAFRFLAHTNAYTHTRTHTHTPLYGSLWFLIWIGCHLLAKTQHANSPPARTHTHTHTHTHYVRCVATCPSYGWGRLSNISTLVHHSDEPHLTSRMLEVKKTEQERVRGT